MTDSEGIGGAIYKMWFAAGAGAALGRAITGEYPIQGIDGLRQDFERGSIHWTGRLGHEFCVALWRENWVDFSTTAGGVPRARVHFKWGPSDPFHYDYWLLRAATGPDHHAPPGDHPLWGQIDFHTDGLSHSLVVRNNGQWAQDFLPDRAGPDGGESVHAIIEGCDNTFSSGLECKQGWSPMLSIRMKP